MSIHPHSPAAAGPHDVEPSARGLLASSSQHEGALLTVPEVMARLKIGRSAVYALIRSGQLPSGTIGRSRRIPADAVSRFVADITEVAA
jgi:excisionase family DNA binding protein